MQLILNRMIKRVNAGLRKNIMQEMKLRKGMVHIMVHGMFIGKNWKLTICWMKREHNRQLKQEGRMGYQLKAPQITEKL
jgi:hypothetical protein